MIAEIGNYSGIANLTFSKMLSAVFGSLKCEKSEGMSWPNWVTEDHFKMMEDAMRLFWEVIFSNKTYLRLRAGLFWQKLHNLTILSGVLLGQLADVFLHKKMAKSNLTNFMTFPFDEESSYVDQSDKKMSIFSTVLE